MEIVSTTAIAINLTFESVFTGGRLGGLLGTFLVTAVSYYFYYAVMFRTSPMKRSTSNKDLKEKDQ